MLAKCLFGCAVFLSCQFSLLAEDSIYSGPQVGEKLSSFQATTPRGDEAGKSFDLLQKADGKPILLIFVHARSRPAFGLMKAISQFAVSKSESGLQSCVIFLTDDPTATEKWMSLTEKQLPKGVLYGISRDGQEGPGAYGLNRNVSLTILIAKEGKVTANFALVQPQLQADGPKIAKAIVDVTGGGKVPTMEELAGEQYANRGKMDNREKMDATRQSDPQLTSLLRAVINKQADEQQVTKAAAELEKYVDEHESARKELGRIATTVVNSGKLSNYGTDAAQTMLRKWVKKYGSVESQPAEKKDE